MYFAAAVIVDKVEEKTGIDIGLFEKLWRAFVEFIPTIILALVLFAIGFLLNKLVIKIMGRGFEKSRIDKTIYSFLSSVVKIALYAIVIVIVLTVLGIPMTSIIAVIGSAGIAIGLAMQSSLSNVAGGVIVLMGKHFKLGDYVKIDNAEGTVSNITIICTKLITLDNKVVYIPNGIVSNSTLINYTQQKIRRVDCIFGISYDNNSDRAIEVIKETLAENEKILQSPAPFVHITAFSASSVDIEIRVWTYTEYYWDVHFSMLENIKRAFDKAEIEIPYNQLDVHLKNVEKVLDKSE